MGGPFFDENTKDARNKIPVHLHDKARRILNELHGAVRLQNLTQHQIKYVTGTPGDEDWYELRINQQYRIYFLWEFGKARFVRVDDHL
ncbi:MAG: type II toxin-antitoxin system RelE/ParE family toxin [bacterium]